MRRQLVAATALLFAGIGAAHAQSDAKAPPPVVVIPSAPVKPVAAPADPARLAVAQRVVFKLVPEGVYKKMFATVFGEMTDQIFGQVGEMPVGEVAKLGGLSQAEAKALGDVKLREIMEIYDPAWRERQKRMMQAFGTGMGDVMVKVEPIVRKALAQAYAREFTVEELTDLDRYFATPAGAHYAAQSLAIAMGPEMTKAMTEMMPEMMSAMPVLMQRAEEATADLPPVRKMDDLSPLERKKLADLLGVDPEKLEDDAS
ncbi:DUF2059 domain-containing protein [Sphingomonas sp. HITSZ_GF]|uniref:DUF2059 domain-containing protein n=1 Tax=Sphingomonas sp. HITSZ_GF TaxID=3037247 RepID=UPI00240E2C53|nr:DUF2059 domain-containing protein [Sphingomonas sp. HITSZ_GF]MDG2534346.1 DUF2059 domain-containing protein [Sphingomonas sp. HITSZ_GF]